ncbi:hypothetical protein M9Y10_045785 [Tritrichomonas musculus]|uniref:IQ calmodulin-binding motif family protein n=1 Tax=Tritrichomonas musculus TaxID=1915356 RepID=A0ABR2JWN5_9EUKA
MRPNRSPRRPQTQLLANRGVLNKINPVIRKKATNKQTNIPIPPEWNENQAQAYRLLVGPQLNNYIAKDSSDTSNTSDPYLKDKSQQEKKEKLLSKLVPSRLKTPITPLQVTNDNIEQLNYPPDLLVQVFPPDQKPKYDLLAKSINRPKTQYAQSRANRLKPLSNIVKPSQIPKKITSTPRQQTQSKPDLSNLSSNIQGTEITDDKFEEEEDKESTLNDEYDYDDDYHTSRKEIKNDNSDQDNDIQKPNQKEIEEEERKKQLIMMKKLEQERKIKQVIRREKIQLRKYFYILRCWAHYKINARIKADFVIDVIRTRKLLSDFKKWHFYVRKILILRSLIKEIHETHQRTVLSNSWKKWANSARKSILDAGKASRYLQKRNNEIKKRVMDELRSVTHSKRICRREIAKNFRYYSDFEDKDAKRYTTITNEYYNDKRKKNIKALHFNFFKKCPIVFQKWKVFVKDRKFDQRQIDHCNAAKLKNMFVKWFKTYQNHFHERIMFDVRKGSHTFQERISNNEREASERVEKTVMLQLLRDKQILKAKLTQFDRLSSNHLESIEKRRDMREQIDTATKNFFVRQEELMLIDSNKAAEESYKKVREIRMQLAEGFLYHLGRALHSFDNQIVGKSYCLSFRVLSEPLVNNAVDYFYEKKQLKHLLKSAELQRNTVKAAVDCSKLYFYGKSWGVWHKFIGLMNSKRTKGLMEIIRRRTVILQLFPYFNWVEILPVRPPRPLKEVEQMFKDLPLVSIQRKVARERVHHVNVRMILMRRRILRDFIRAYASYVQEQIAKREVMKLFKRRKSLKLLVRAFYAFKTNWDGQPPRNKSVNNQELIIKSDINAWFRHFFRVRVNQRKIAEKVPIS